MNYVNLTIMSDDVHARLKRARKTAGFKTAREAAESLGIAYQTYVGHENGRARPNIDEAAKYARRYKVSCDWLLTGKGRGPTGTVDVANEIYMLIRELPEPELDKIQRVVRAMVPHPARDQSV